jgi:hypothetical protein
VSFLKFKDDTEVMCGYKSGDLMIWKLDHSKGNMFSLNSLFGQKTQFNEKTSPNLKLGNTELSDTPIKSISIYNNRFSISYETKIFLYDGTTQIGKIDNDIKHLSYLQLTSDNHCIDNSNGTSVVTVNGPGGNIELTSAGVTTLTVTDTWANVAGNAYVSNNFTVNNIATVGSLTFKSYSAADGSQLSTTSSIRTQSFTTTSISSNQTIAQIDITGTGYRAAEFFIKGENPAGGKYTVATVHAIHNGSTLVEWIVFGSVNIGASLHTGYSVSITSGTQLRLRVSPSTTDSIVWTTQIRLI